MAKRLHNPLFLAALLISAFVHTTQASTGTSGADFLAIPVGAAPAALGGAYSALAQDAYSPTWNPAGLGFLESTQVAAQHLSYLETINYEYASAVHPIKEGRAMGIAAQYLTSGDIAGTDPFGAPIGDFSSHYGAYALAYGQKVSDRLSLGLAPKWINAKISDVSANAYGVDLGALYKLRENVNLAATVNNIGSPLKFVSSKDSLPLAFHLGAASRLTTHWLLAIEGVYTREGAASFHGGGEWRPLDVIAIRAGYRTDTLKELSPLAGFSTGIGLDFWGQEFSYAWLPYDDLGSTHYFSLLLRFGETGEKKNRNLIQYQSINGHPSTKNLRSTDPEFDPLMELLQPSSPQTSQNPDGTNPEQEKL